VPSGHDPSRERILGVIGLETSDSTLSLVSGLVIVVEPQSSDPPTHWWGHGAASEAALDVGSEDPVEIVLLADHGGRLTGSARVFVDHRPEADDPSRRVWVQVVGEGPLRGVIDQHL
jgi:hypothetical protein